MQDFDEKQEQPRAAVFGSRLGDRTADRRSPNQRGSARGCSFFPQTSAWCTIPPMVSLLVRQGGFL